MQTLVLDMGYQPINAVAPSRAFKYITKGKVEVLASYDQPIHPDWETPAVVRLLHLIRPHTKKVKFSRKNVLARDRWKCQYCGVKLVTSDATFDHVHPRSKGGKTTWENIVTACVPCNHRKADFTIAKARMKLRKQPYRPSWLPIFSISLQGILHVPHEWRDYWNAELLP